MVFVIQLKWKFLEKRMINKAFLSLGSNIGIRIDNLNNAINFLDKYSIEVLKKSSIYKSSPMYNLNQDFFYNMIIEVRTTLLPFELLKNIKKIEKNMGRELSVNENMPRIIDIDILTYKNIEINSKKLVIPHNKLSERKFVLLPWEEVAPNYYISSLGKTVKQLLDALDDISEVEKIEKELV